MHKNLVLKFGGVCLSDSNNIKKVISLIEKEKQNHNKVFVVVSAPGQRNENDVKVTDLLIELFESIKISINFEAIWQKIVERFLDIAKVFNIVSFVKKVLNYVKSKIKKQNSLDYTISRGEYITAKMLAKIMQAEFLDARDVIKVKGENSVIESLTFEKLKPYAHSSFSNVVVIPGFYGSTINGKIKTFTRDGSDFSASIVAKFVNASHYISVKDVDGLMSVNPRIVKNPVKVKTITLEQLQQVTQNGAKILHPSTVEPLLNTQTVLEIKNLFSENSGTIVTNTPLIQKHAFISMTGRPEINLVSFNKTENWQLLLKQVITAFENLGETIYNIIFETNEILFLTSTNNEKLETMLLELFNADLFTFQSNLSEITIVGANFNKDNLVKKIVNVLQKNNIKILALNISHKASLIKLIILEKHYNKAILQIYNQFFKQKLFFNFKPK